jgi:hypothetical protein
VLTEHIPLPDLARGELHVRRRGRIRNVECWEIYQNAFSNELTVATVHGGPHKVRAIVLELEVRMDVLRKLGD